jgi:hypothetical protein
MQEKLPAVSEMVLPPMAGEHSTTSPEKASVPYVINGTFLAASDPDPRLAILGT